MVLTDDDDNKSVWPTWAVGALFKGVCKKFGGYKQR